MKNVEFRRIIVAFIIVVIFAISMSLSLIFLSTITSRLGDNAQSLTFTLFLSLIFITILITVLKPMKRLLKNITENELSLVARPAIGFYGLTGLLGFSFGIVIFGFTGSLIYLIFR